MVVDKSHRLTCLMVPLVGFASRFFDAKLAKSSIDRFAGFPKSASVGAFGTLRSKTSITGASRFSGNSSMSGVLAAGLSQFIDGADLISRGSSRSVTTWRM